MEKKEERETNGRKPEEAGRERMVRRPITAEERAEIMKNRPKWSCHDCIFRISSVCLWARTLLSGFPVTGMCANHPDTPGQMRPVPGRPCRNFRAKVQPPVRLEPPAPPNGKVAYISLTRGLQALVDAEDYEWLNQYKWYASRRDFPYACRMEKRKVLLMHREIMRPPKGMVVDHINGNGLDNRRCNLRICTQEQNMCNNRGHAGKKSRFRGVFPRRDKWEAKVTYKGEEYYLGLFDDEVEAAKARDRKAGELFGEYAWLNLPPEDPEGEGQ